MTKKGKLLVEYDATDRGGLLDFYDRVTDELKHRNPSGKWEADVVDHLRYGLLPWDELDDASKTYQKGISFFAEYAVELFRYFPIGYTATPPGRIKVFELGKTGLHLEYAKGHLHVRILPKCHDGFYRDWEHDGICVAEIREP